MGYKIYGVIFHPRSDVPYGMYVLFFLSGPFFDTNRWEGTFLCIVSWIVISKTECLSRAACPCLARCVLLHQKYKSKMMAIEKKISWTSATLLGWWRVVEHFLNLASKILCGVRMPRATWNKDAWTRTTREISFFRGFSLFTVINQYCTY